MTNQRDPFKSLGAKVNSIEELHEIAPAVFATQAAIGVTDSYNFVSTDKIVNNILDLGWQLHSAKQDAKTDFGRHFVRFTHPDMGFMNQVEKDKVKPQIILDNSHNRISSTKIHMGLFRLVCSNGLVVAIPGMYSSVKFRHMGVNKAELKQVLEAAASQYFKIGSRVNDMQMVSLNQDQKEEFAIRAIASREPHMFMKDDNTINIKAVTQSTNPLEIITPIRGEDAPNNLWATFNVIQERMIKGGYQRITGANRQSTTKGISSGSRNLELNKTLWTIAESYLNPSETFVESEELVLS